MSDVTSTIPRLLRVREAAELTGIEEWRFYELLKKGKGPKHMRVGRVIRISEAALVGWIEQEHAAPTNAEE